MAAKKRGLGRGLDALLGAGLGEEKPSEIGDEEFRLMPVDIIQRGAYQPRRDMDPDSLQELADSIREQGVIQPIVVRPVLAGRFEIIAGERRWRASQLAGLQEVPVIVRSLSDKVALSVAIIENIQREDLNPLEEAIALDRLLNEFGMTHQLVADAVGRSRASVSNLLRLLDLEDEVKQHLSGGDIEMGHARAILPLNASTQKKAARDVIAKGLSVRQTEAMVRKLQATNDSSVTPLVTLKDPNISHLEQTLSERLSARVSLKHNKKGKGILSVQFNSLDELEGILDHIK